MKISERLKDLIWRVFGVRIWSIIYGNPCEPKNCPQSSPECEYRCANIMDDDWEAARDMMEERDAIYNGRPEDRYDWP